MHFNAKNLADVNLKKCSLEYVERKNSLKLSVHIIFVAHASFCCIAFPKYVLYCAICLNK